MYQKYLMQYTDDYKRQTYLKLVEAPSGSTWRELQQKFDPYYHYSYLKFYVIGTEIKNDLASITY